METLLDKKQVAELLTISVKTLDLWIILQKAPKPVRIGRLVRFKQSEVAAFINQLSSEGN
ncbi:MAG: helix-turn-helix domain-containing protein [Desulfuromonadaceae bacterium]|nr:helix-turn-helix domain-containing protein [Desulfuromonadaceae bacterium]MDD5104794.1 helix-turn-helix domain-containing protein [Desulfuromonadaceae bacterium]